ncbi:MAG: hypothetical protein WCK47_11460 [bacterium]|nr:hypothetical protein [Candidatus Sumerlaeota bacterium]
MGSFGGVRFGFHGHDIDLFSGIFGRWNDDLSFFRFAGCQRQRCGYYRENSDCYGGNLLHCDCFDSWNIKQQIGTRGKNPGTYFFFAGFFAASFLAAGFFAAAFFAVAICAHLFLDKIRNNANKKTTAENDCQIKNE